jgi:hypothetical protein
MQILAAAEKWEIENAQKDRAKQEFVRSLLPTGGKLSS